MVTRFDDKFDFDDTFNAEVIESVAYSGEETIVKVYIPVLMSDIMHGDPGIAFLTSPSNRVFVNTDDTIPITTSNRIYEKNYLNSKIKSNANVEPISDVEYESVIEEINVNLSISNKNIFTNENMDDTEKSNSSTDKVYSYMSNDNLPEDEILVENNASVYSKEIIESLIKSAEQSKIETDKNVSSSDEIDISDCIFRTGIDDASKYQLISLDGEVIYDSNIRGNDGNKISITNLDDDNTVFKSSNTSDAMIYDLPSNNKKFNIKKNSLVQCEFLNEKASKLYMKSI